MEGWKGIARLGEGGLLVVTSWKAGSVGLLLVDDNIFVLNAHAKELALPGNQVYTATCTKSCTV